MHFREAQKHTDPTDQDPHADPEHWFKVVKKSQNSRNQVLTMEGSGAGSRAGLVLVTNGFRSGSGRP
jgi:hypothetical protein